jgi:MFS family permease
MTINNNKNKEFLKILLGTFISQSGSYFMTLSLAAAFYILTNSVIGAATIMVLSYLPAVFVSGLVGNIVDKKLSRQMLVLLEVFSASISILCAVFLYYHYYIILLILLTLRSCLSFTTRAAQTRWVKIITPENSQSKRIKLLLLAFFLSTTTAGILVGVVIGDDIYSGITKVAVIDFITYLVSVIIIWTLHEPNNLRTPKSYSPLNFKNIYYQTLSTILDVFKDKSLMRPFLFVVFSQGLFQGAYQALISIMPNYFNKSISAISLFQISASVGLLFAFIFLWIKPNLPYFKYSYFIVISLGILSMIMVIIVGKMEYSVIFFGIFNLFYEIVWLHNRSVFFVKTPISHVGRYQFTLDSLAGVVMSLCTISCASLIKVFDHKVGVLYFIISTISIFIAVSFYLDKFAKLDLKSNEDH